MKGRDTINEGEVIGICCEIIKLAIEYCIRVIRINVMREHLSS